MATSRNAPGLVGKRDRLELEPPLPRVLPGWGKLVYLRVKRFADFTTSGVLLVSLSPVLLLIALFVRLDSPGPVLFKQARMGYRWRSRQQHPFTCYKFRSMYHNCDQSVHERYVVDRIRGWEGESGADDACVLAKLVDDNRITRFGRILRRTSLDELPQLWNVLRGEMSLVGPRPVPLYEVAQYNQWQEDRLEATPGMTGLWQVRGRGRVTVGAMAQMDIDYIARRSFWLDLEILVLTLPAVFRGLGAG